MTLTLQFTYVRLQHCLWRTNVPFLNIIKNGWWPSRTTRAPKEGGTYQAHKSHKLPVYFPYDQAYLMGGSYGKVYGNEGASLGKSLKFPINTIMFPSGKVRKEVYLLRFFAWPIGILAHPKLKNGFMKPTPPKINGWNLRIHLFEKENHLNQTIIFRFKLLIFGVVNTLRFVSVIDCTPQSSIILWGFVFGGSLGVWCRRGFASYGQPLMFPSNPHWKKQDMYGKTLKNLDLNKKKSIVKLCCKQNLLTG